MLSDDRFIPAPSTATLGHRTGTPCLLERTRSSAKRCHNSALLSLNVDPVFERARRARTLATLLGSTAYVRYVCVCVHLSYRAQTRQPLEGTKKRRAMYCSRTPKPRYYFRTCPEISRWCTVRNTAGRYLHVTYRCSRAHVCR